VGLVDQRRVLGLSRLDPTPGRIGAAGVEGDGDDLKAGGVQLLAQRLPPGQVEATASP
jgi:hypothetical protein